MSIAKAASYAAGEVFLPVFTGTLTTLMPFVPLLFWPGIIGKFMSNLPVTLIITLGASLFVAYVMNPVFAVSFMQREEHGKLSEWKDYKKAFIFFIVLALCGYLFLGNGIGNFAVVCLICIVLYILFIEKAILFFQNRLWPKVLNVYRAILKVFIKRYTPIAVCVGALLFLILSWVFYLSTNPKVENFPNGEPNFAFVYCKMPIGTDASTTDSVTRFIEQRVHKVLGEKNPIVSSVITNVGLGAGDPDNPDRVPTPHKSKVSVAFVRFADRGGKSTTEVLDSLRNEFASGVAGAEISVEKERNGPPTGKPISIEISGDDFDVLDRIGKNLTKRIGEAGIRGIDGLKSDLQVSKPEIILKIDEEKAQREGVTVAQIALEIRTALFGKEVSKFRDKNDDAPIILRLQEKDRLKVEELLNLDISFMDMAAGQFKQVPISSLAKISYGNSISGINRKNQKRLVTFSSDVMSGYNAADIITQITELSKRMEIPEGYEIAFTGDQEAMNETIDFFAVAFPAALAFMFLILVTLFNSAVKPMIIFSTVLFSLIGIALGFGIFRMTLSVVMTGVGVFALAGIVVRNGILLVEFIDELRMRGLSIQEAVVEGGATRLTPVVLTASAAILGLIPLAIGLNMDFESLFTHFDAKFFLGGDNVAFWGPLAWTMIFGLIVATFLTLLVLPTMYMLGYKTREKFRRLFSKIF